ncbi:MAG: DUF1326 domain-containing protein [Candidatus Rokubacteria bacterium]|nr:DUF1326 domain-containing protein [Candidatus Rokubacteria bacterium]
MVTVRRTTKKVTATKTKAPKTKPEAAPTWRLSGDYFETCSCTYLCPCVPTNLAGQPTKGHCYFAFVFHIEQGRYGDLKLDGLNFAILGQSPGAMAEGNWSVGLITDERARAEQQQALTAIASGQAGGPMAAVASLIGRFLGVQAQPIRYQKAGMTRSVSIPEILDQAIEGVAPMGSQPPAEPMYLDNTPHPANKRLALARAVRSHLHAFELNWDDASGRNNGHFAPFNWQGTVVRV